MFKLWYVVWIWNTFFCAVKPEMYDGEHFKAFVWNPVVQGLYSIQPANRGCLPLEQSSCPAQILPAFKNALYIYIPCVPFSDLHLRRQIWTPPPPPQYERWREMEQSVSCLVWLPLCWHENDHFQTYGWHDSDFACTKWKSSTAGVLIPKYMGYIIYTFTLYKAVVPKRFWITVPLVLQTHPSRPLPYPIKGMI